MSSSHTTIRNALHNFAIDSGASDEYCKGLLVGVVSGMMGATGDGFLTFGYVVAFVSKHMPTNARTLTPDNVPESWLSLMR